MGNSKRYVLFVFLLEKINTTNLCRKRSMGKVKLLEFGCFCLEFLCQCEILKMDFVK